jgi:hypothetical protein
MSHRSLLVLLAITLPASSLGCGDLLRTCDDMQDEARTMVAVRQACSTGDTCVIVQMSDITDGNNCLGAFQCSIGIRDDVDVDAFSAEAKALSSDYSRCNMCVMAGCVATQDLEACCDVDTGQCVVDIDGGFCGAPEERP